MIWASGRPDRLFLETEIPPVAKQSIGTLERTQINIRSSVPIDIADGQPGSIVGHRIGQEGVAFETIGEVQPGLPKIESCEASDACRHGLQELGLNLGGGVGRRRRRLSLQRESTPDPDSNGENSGRRARKHRLDAEKQGEHRETPPRLTLCTGRVKWGDLRANPENGRHLGSQEGRRATFRHRGHVVWWTRRHNLSALIPGFRAQINQPIHTA